MTTEKEADNSQSTYVVYPLKENGKRTKPLSLPQLQEQINKTAFIGADLVSKDGGAKVPLKQIAELVVGFHVFLSHSHSQKDVAHRLWTYLEDHGIRCWIDAECIPKSIRGGTDSWEARIAAGVLESSAFLLLHSEAANLSDNIAKEVSAAAKAKKHMIVVRLENVELAINLDFNLHDTQHIQAFNIDESDELQLFAQIEKAIRVALANADIVLEPPKSTWWSNVRWKLPRMTSLASYSSLFLAVASLLAVCFIAIPIIGRKTPAPPNKVALIEVYRDFLIGSILNRGTDNRFNRTGTDRFEAVTATNYKGEGTKEGFQLALGEMQMWWRNQQIPDQHVVIRDFVGLLPDEESEALFLGRRNPKDEKPEIVRALPLREQAEALVSLCVEPNDRDQSIVIELSSTRISIARGNDGLFAPHIKPISILTEELAPKSTHNDSEALYMLGRRYYQTALGDPLKGAIVSRLGDLRTSSKILFVGDLAETMVQELSSDNLTENCKISLTAHDLQDFIDKGKSIRLTSDVDPTQRARLARVALLAGLLDVLSEELDIRERHQQTMDYSCTTQERWSRSRHAVPLSFQVQSLDSNVESGLSR